MNYYEFCTKIEELDVDKFYLIRVPSSLKQQQLLTIQSMLNKKGLNGIIWPDYISLEELTPEQIQFLLAKNGKQNENIQNDKK